MLNYHNPKRDFFSALTLKEGSTSHPCPLSSGAREKTALLGARNRYALRLADQVRLLRLTTSVVSTSGRTSISSRWLSRLLIDCSAERKARIWISSPTLQIERVMICVMPSTLASSRRNSAGSHLFSLRRVSRRP